MGNKSSSIKGSKSSSPEPAALSTVKKERCAAAVIGGGAREHAIAWKLAQSSTITHIYMVPGNGAIELYQSELERLKSNGVDVENIPKIIALNEKVEAPKFEQLIDSLIKEQVQMVAVGPEQFLCDGIADALAEKEIACFGPNKASSEFEGDKAYAKYMMEKMDVPTASWYKFTDGDPNHGYEHAISFIRKGQFARYVIKASNLCGGKGVFLPKTLDEAEGIVTALMKEKTLVPNVKDIVIEEYLEGQEVSALVFTDGESYSLMPFVKDYKRRDDGDEGTNTGGMGAIAPLPKRYLNWEERKKINKLVFNKIFKEFQERNINYVGVLYAGLMMVKTCECNSKCECDREPRVLEFNCRFGDPECQVLMPLLKTDLFKVMKACTDKTLKELTVEWKDDLTALAVVLASKDYPNAREPLPSAIVNLPSPRYIIDASICRTIFFANVRSDADKLLTNGGRVLSCVATSPNPLVAYLEATSLAASLDFGENRASFRRDIGHDVLAFSILESRSKLTYASCGVDIAKFNKGMGKLQDIVGRTATGQASCKIGGFGARCNLNGGNMPFLIVGTDGVGSKLEIAREMSKLDVAGIDLVAMSANDVLCHGAAPKFMVDYYACGKLDTKQFESVMTGISEGCQMAGCALVGGETAEIPCLYSKGKIDISGTVIGVCQNESQYLPKFDKILDGDLIIGIASNGLHSNGFSLINRLYNERSLRYIAPFPAEGAFDDAKLLGEALLNPTRIYAKPLLPLMHSEASEVLIKAAAHITGGGLVENVQRILPNKGVCARIDASKWSIPPVFAWAMAEGPLEITEALKTFNLGIGMVLIVDGRSETVAELLSIGDAKGGMMNGAGDGAQPGAKTNLKKKMEVDDGAEEESSCTDDDGEVEDEEEEEIVESASAENASTASIMGSIVSRSTAGSCDLSKYTPHSVVINELNKSGEKAFVIGHIEALGDKENSKVKVENLDRAMMGALSNVALYQGKLIGNASGGKETHVANLAVLASGGGTNFEAIVKYANKQRFWNNLGGARTLNSELDYKPWRVSLLICNKSDANAINRAAMLGIPCVVIENKAYPTRVEFDEAIDSTLGRFNIDYIALAGFMRILDDKFCKKWSGKMLNTHPSLLPSFPGKDAHKQSHDARVAVAGCSIHYVEPTLDLGPVVAQAAVENVNVDAISADELQARIKERENYVFPRAIDAMINGLCEYKAGDENKQVLPKAVWKSGEGMEMLARCEGF